MELRNIETFTSNAQSRKQKLLLEKIVFGGPTRDAACDSNNERKDAVKVDVDDDDDATATDGETSDDEAPDELPIADVDPGLSVVGAGAPMKRESTKMDRGGAAWVDEDDQQVIIIPRSLRLRTKLRRTGDSRDNVVTGGTYENRLRDQFKSTMGGGADSLSWANVSMKQKRSKRFTDSDDSDAEDDDIRRKAGRLVGTTAVLHKATLDFVQQRDITFGHRKRGKCIHSVEFHKTAQIALTAGDDQRLMLFQIDGKENPSLHSVAFDSFPIDAAHFARDGASVLVGSRLQPFFYKMDMVESKVVKIPLPKVLGSLRTSRFVMSQQADLIAVLGRGGQIHLLSGKSMEWIDTLQMNGEAAAFCFDPTSDTAYSHGEEGQVYIWDIKARRCVHKFVDEGCIRGSALGVSADGRRLACGSNSGIVNMYDVNSLKGSTRPSPSQVLSNLVTAVTHIVFNPSREITAFASNRKEDAAKLLHTNSATVFKNFPPRNMQKVQCIDFSVNGGYLGMANDQGSVKLFRLNHYPNY